jgi:tRNA dimethylallyltransferase
MLPKIITILGPTGSGKSNLGVKLAQEFQGEIISADSRQIYIGFIIGSNLIKGSWQNNQYLSQGIPHYLVQFQDPQKNFSAAQFQKMAFKKINEILERKKRPFLVGGTGLYIDAVLKNLAFSKIKANQSLRKKLAQKPAQELYQKLKILDPQATQNIDQNNKKRLIRALEVCLLGNTQFSKTQKQGKKLFDALKIGIKIPRQELYKKIDNRVDQMIEEGLINETENLLKLYPEKAPAFSGIGYKQTIQYLAGEISKEEMTRKIKTATHAYARRQITWFKRDQSIQWINNYEEAKSLIKEFIV